MKHANLDNNPAKNDIVADKQKYSDLSTVEAQKDNLLPEELPEGPYGSAINSEVLGKKEDHLVSQRAVSAFTYENKQLHEGIPRRYPVSHPLDEKKHSNS